LQRVRGLRIPVGTPPDSYPLEMAWVARTNERYQPYRDVNGKFAGAWANVGALNVIRSNTFPPPEDVPMDTRLADGFVAGGVRLLGYDTLPLEVLPGATFDLTLHWQAVPNTPRTLDDYTLTLGDAVLTGDSLWERQPPADWFDGQLMTERRRVTVPTNAAAGRWPLTIAWGDVTLALDEIMVSAVERMFTLPPVAVEVNAPFGEAVTLSGYTLTTEAEAHTLELVWGAEAALTTDYTVYVHLLDANGGILTQTDAMPRENSYPTSVWIAGEFVTDTYTLPALADGVTFRVGLYDSVTGAQLSDTPVLIPLGG
jgi:hypothetical protein